MYKIDLHTHSTASPDGALLASHYREALHFGMLDYIAVTDHNSISFAQKLQRELGNQIIVGEEISTLQGEIIGLYLKECIQPELDIKIAIKAIRDQRGLVYIPHPFETVRRGLSLRTLNSIAGEVDIVEIHNGRALFQNRSAKARAWSARNDTSGASSSDAHGKLGWLRTYSVISSVPTRNNLVALLKDAQYRFGTVGLFGAFYPKMSRLHRIIHRA